MSSSSLADCLGKKIQEAYPNFYISMEEVRKPFLTSEFHVSNDSIRLNFIYSFFSYAARGAKNSPEPAKKSAELANPIFRRK